MSDSFEVDGMTIRAVSDTVDLSPIPLRKVVEAIDSKYRKEAVVELTDNDIVSGSISLDVAAFGKSLTDSTSPRQRKSSRLFQEISCFKSLVSRPHGTRVLPAEKACSSI